MKRKPQKPAALVRNPLDGLVRADSVESPTWGNRVMRLLGAFRQDGWQSTLGGLGSRGDRGRPGSLAFVEQLPLTDYELTNAYRNLWLVRRLVEARPEEALREGFGIEPDKIPEFMRLNYEGYHSEGASERALRMAELKGGAGVYVGYANVSSPEQLLEPAPEGPQPIAFLETFDRFQLQAQERERDTYSPTFDQPTVWSVTGSRRSGMRFHTSRLIKFKGAPLGGDQGLTEQDRDWGDSVLQAVWADVQRYGVFWQSVAHLMQLSSIGVMSISGLVDMLASQNQDVAQARVDLLNESMSLTRLMLLDAGKGEEYHREAVSFTDMPALLQEVQLATAGAFKMPATKLFGRAPAGMNATGESDMRNWYDEVACYQQRQVKPGLLELLKRTDGVSEIEFKPLWQESERECAETRKITIDANERLWSMGVVSPEEIRKSMHEGKPIEEAMKGPPTAEPTRAITQIQVVPPEKNAVAPNDPEAPDEKPSPVAKAKGFFDSVERRDISEFWDKTTEQLIEEANAKLAKANDKLVKGLNRYRAAAARSETKIAKLKARPDFDQETAEAIEAGPSEAFADVVAEYAEDVDAAYTDIETEIDSIDLNPDKGDLQGQKARQATLRAASAEFEDVHTSANRAAEGLFEGHKVNVAKVKAIADRATQTGSRGGRFYFSSSGGKVYVK